MLTAGLGLFLRSTAGTLTAVFLLVFALPVRPGEQGRARALVAVSDALPGRAIVSLIAVDQVELSPNAIAVVMVAWTSAAVLAGAWSLLRRDAS